MRNCVLTKTVRACILGVFTQMAAAEFPPSSAVDPYADLTDLYRLAQPLTGRTGQTSSYDRTRGNGDAIFWYYMRAEPKRVVMADLRGPGSVARIWVTAYDPAVARIEIFVDDATTPVISQYMRDFFGSGASPPFVPPLNTPTTGSWVAYVPIPFQKSCRVEAINARQDNNTIYYNITYRQYPEGEPVANVLQSPITVTQQNALNTFAQQWNNRGQDPKPPLPNAQTASGTPAVGAGQTIKLLDVSGPGVVTGVRLNISPQHHEVLSNARIRMRWDGNATNAVDAPLGAFFGMTFPPKNAPAYPLGIKDGHMYAYWAMPFANGAIIELVNTTGMAITSANFSVTWAPLNAAHVGRMRFHTQARGGTVFGGQPSYRILDVTGRGHYLGCVMSIAPPGGHWGILEGDEEIYVNGEVVASILGTGTEDYFNGGFYFSGGEVSLPFHGVPLLQNNPPLLTSVYRLHVPDPVVFRNGCIVDMEHGGVNETTGDYRTVAFYYRDDAAGQTPAEPVHPTKPFQPLHNGDFEQSFGGYNGGEASGWIGWQSREYYGQPGSTFARATDQKRSGAASQRVVVAGYGSGPRRAAGIAQQVQVKRGAHYRVTAHLRLGLSNDLFPGDLIGRFGVGAEGNTYFEEPTVQWADTPPNTNTWHELSIVVTALKDHLTIFAGGVRPSAKGWGTASVWIDDVTIEPHVGPPPPPPLPDVVNEGFEQNLNNFVWPKWSGPDGNDQNLERVYSQSGNPDGTWMLMAKGLGATGKGAYQYIPNNWQDGQDYRVSVFVRNLGAASIRYAIGYQFGAPGAGGGVGATYGPEVQGTGSWQKITVEFTYTGESGVTIYLKAINAGSPEAAAFDKVEIEQLTFGPAPVSGDFDADGDIDQSDYGRFQACYSGPGVAQPDPACAGVKFDLDDDVDTQDFTIFQACISGPGVPVDPLCIP